MGVAIGSPFQLEALTVGLSVLKAGKTYAHRLEDFIQTDAAIKPRQLSALYYNLDSEVIGINTGIVSRSGGYMGIGFAIQAHG